MFSSYQLLGETFTRLNRRFDARERISLIGYRKGLEAEQLLSGFNQLLEDIESKTEALQQSEMKFRALAYHDTLTGLPNRLFITERLWDEMAKASR
ncbi:hypothetical protein SCACP_34660 [Sporomusa carbonis]|uniref:hypothetical protein n=1 Tax=Sporomusa carbonis TaxID=3076075 RepID=UPI003A788A04